jgi:hypothetical protein
MFVPINVNVSLYVELVYQCESFELLEGIGYFNVYCVM